MAGNAVTLTIGGDATQLQRAAQQATQATEAVTSSVTESSTAMAAAGQESAGFGTKLGHLGSSVSGATDALDAIGGSLTAVNDLMNLADTRASAQRRALIAVEQAQEDYNQALRDGAQASLDSEQAGIDLEQANLDASVALKDYNAAVKEFGVNSDEAKQASLDLKQSQHDVAQAQEDSAQFTRDAAQATIDAKSAQEDLNDANKAAHPPELQKWADGLAIVTPILSSLIGVIGIMTAVQWSWNASLFASPITWIVLAVIALVAIIVLIAVKTTWFQDLWKWAWTGIKDAAAAVWDWISGTLWPGIQAVWEGIVFGVTWVKDKFAENWNTIKATVSNVWDWLGGLPARLGSMFASIAGFITAPFRTAFNYVSDAWNNTIGRLHWSVPSWVPGVGGNSISAPRLPHFHQGGVFPGSLGAEGLAVLQAGEVVSPAGGGGGMTLTIESGGSRLDDLLVEVLQRAVARRGGNVQRVLGSTRG
jgi:hypothetical protein